MKRITQKEIDNAPAWATHYNDERGNLFFENEIHHQWVRNRLSLIQLIKKQSFGLASSSKKLPHTVDVK